jgi:hypothetical protein
MKPLSLLRTAQINNQHGRKALRWLQDHGDYDGFGRPAPAGHEPHGPHGER